MPSIKLSSGTEMFYSIPTCTDPSIGLTKPQIDPDRPTILFIHATACDSRSWSAQIMDPVINQNFNLVCLDLPFAGLTRTPKDWQPGRKALAPPAPNENLSTVKPFWSLEQQGEDCLDLIKKLKLPPLHLIGCCVGTAICTYMIVSNPSMWKSAIFISPASLLETPHNQFQFADVWRSLLDPEHGDEHDAYQGIHALFFGHQDCGQHYRQKLSTYLPTEEVRRYILGQWWGSIIARKSIPVQNAQKAFTMPICLASGTEHVTHPTAKGELEEMLRDAKNCPWWETHHLGDAPTMANMTNPREVNRIICRFIAKCERRPLRVYDSHVTGYNLAWKDPYSALEERLRKIEQGTKSEAAAKSPSRFKLSGITQVLSRAASKA